MSISSVVDDKPFDETSLTEDEVLSNIDENISDTEEMDSFEEEIKADIPEKFKGKSVEEVAQAYGELEKQFGQKANEVGELRKLADDFLKRELETPTTEVDKDDIDLDTFLENPSDAIRKAVKESPEVKKLENELLQARINEQKNVFEKQHPDWADVMQDSDFQSWVTSNSILQQTFMEADRNYDYQKGSELLTMYKNIRGERAEAAKEKATTKRKRAMKATTTERGGSGEAPKKVYLRSDLITLKQRDPERYLAMGEEIRQAYLDGRIK